MVHFRNEFTPQNGNQFIFFLFQSNILKHIKDGNLDNAIQTNKKWNLLGFHFEPLNNFVFVVDVKGFATQTIGAVLPIVCTKVYLGTYFKPELCDCAVAPCSCILNILLHNINLPYSSAVEF